MKKILTTTAACTGVCLLAWLIDSPNAKAIATVGIICTVSACLAHLWRDNIRRVVSRASSAYAPHRAKTPPTAPQVLAFIAAMLLLLGVRETDGAGLMLVVDLVSWGALIGVLALLISALKGRIRGRRPTRRHSTRDRRAVPPAMPAPPSPDPCDMGKTRPMPRRH